MVEALTYDAVWKAFPAGAERERIKTNIGLHPDWRITGTGSWKIVGCPTAIGSIADFASAERHVDHLRMDDVIFIHFGLGGTIEFHLENGQRYRESGQRLSFFSLARGTLVKRVIPANQRVKFVGISLRISELANFGCTTASLHNDLSALVEEGALQPFLVNFSLTPQQYCAADDLLNNDFTDQLRQRFVEAKLTELLCLAIAQLLKTRQGSTRTIGRSARDRDDQALEIAGKILSSETGVSWTLSSLSNRVGLNRNKLSAGFKERFGTTPLSFSRRERLKRARVLVESSSLSMNEIAWRAGFASQSSFTRAYRLEFGAPPRCHRLG